MTMADLDERFRSFSRTRTPDLWRDIEHREPGPSPAPPARRRLLAIAVAFTVAAVGIGAAAITFGGSERQTATGMSGALVGPKTNGEIWFRVGGGDGGSRIESVAADGSGRRVVFEGEPTRVAQVAWSPDGTRIAYQNPIVDERGIFVANADGTDPVRLTRGVNDAWPSWSPDGTRIVFSSTRYDPSIGPCTPGDDAHCPTDLYIVNADGPNLGRLTVGPSNAYQAAWSPTGDEIASTQGTGYIAAAPTWVAVMDAGGSDVRVVSTGDGGSDFRPSWSPDGSRIVFAAIRNDDWGIWTVRTDGSGEHRILGGEGMGYVDDPVWSPDGSLIAFVGNRTVDDYSPDDALYVMHPDGTDVTKLADAPGVGVAGDIAWRPVPADNDLTPSPDALVPTRAEVVETFDMGQDARSLVFGDGSVWVATASADGSGRIVRIDPETYDVQAVISVGPIPTWEVGGGAMVFADGDLWVAGDLNKLGGLARPGGGADAAVVRIDPSTNEVVQVFAMGGVGAADLTFLEGDLWVLVFGDETVDHRMEVVRVDPETGDVTTRIPLETRWAHTIAAVDGRLVVLEAGKGGTNVDGSALAIDPATGSIEGATIPSETFVPMPVLWRGQAWIGLEPGFARFDPLAGAFPEAPISLDPGDVTCCGFLEADDRGIWFLSPDPSGGSGRRLLVFDPATGEVHDLVTLDEGDPVAMAIAPNAVWILNYEGTLTHVELG
jgi:TolB protein